MNWIILLCVLELGGMPDNTWYSDSVGAWFSEPAYYAIVDVEVVTFEHFFVGGWIETCMMKEDGEMNFDPFQMTFEFRAGIRFDPVEIGFEHVCGPHPVRSYPRYYDNDPVTPFEGSYDKIYLRIEKQF